jgi:hypothetical protein
VLAELYFKGEQYKNAITFYKKIRMYEEVKECYQALKKKEKQNGLLREEEADFFVEIGEY